MPPKGQLFSEWIYEDKTSPKKQTKNCKDFCPHSQGKQEKQKGDKSANANFEN